MVACWGDNRRGQLGAEPLSLTTQGREWEHLHVVSVPDLGIADHVAAGDDFTCAAVLDDVVCWGGAAVEWGSAPTCSERVTFSLPEGRAIAYRAASTTARIERAPHRALDAGEGFACVLSASGIVSCWGRAELGQLGDADPRMRPLPIDVALPDGASAVGIAVGGAHACAWTEAGEAFCWGANDAGQLGRGDRAVHVGAARVTALDAGLQIRSMVAGARHTCALVGEGSAARVHCWGANDRLQLGVGPIRAAVLEAVRVEEADGALEVHAGFDSTCITTSVEGEPTCWGDNRSGQAAISPTISTALSAAESAPTGVYDRDTRYALGSRHMCRLVYSVVQVVHCSGANDLLQLGTTLAKGEDFRALR